MSYLEYKLAKDKKALEVQKALKKQEPVEIQEPASSEPSQETKLFDDMAMHQKLDEYKLKLKELKRKDRNKRKADRRMNSMSDYEKMIHNRHKHLQAKKRKKAKSIPAETISL